MTQAHSHPIDPRATKIPFEAPPFRARSPWWGADLQTLRNVLVGAAARPRVDESRRLRLPLSDETGDALCTVLTEPVEQPSSLPLIVLIHGLSGSEDSAYMRMSTRFWCEHGYRVLRLNLRGAGPSRAHCEQQYHAGRTEDLRDALGGLPEDLARNGFILIGYSLGGNMLLKFTAEFGHRFPVRAAASVSAPIDLAAASQRFLDPRNWVYHQHLLRNMKRECFGGPGEVSATERQAIESCRSILEFDERVVAPRNGFRNAAHYYEVNHARRFLGGIEVPTLLLHARNDPWIPADAYTSYPFHRNPNLHPVLTPGGGHVGFHDRSGAEPYHDRCIHAFVSRIVD